MDYSYDIFAGQPGLFFMKSKHSLTRAKKRAENSNRKDDQNFDIHLKRIEIFEAETRPAIEYMKDKFKVANIDGLGTIERITKTINEIINTSR